MVKLTLDSDTAKVAGAGLAAAGLAGLASALGGGRDYDLPPPPARRPARQILSGLEDIEDLQVMETDTVARGRAYTIEFHLPDRDPKFASSLAIGTDAGRIREATIRLGPLGHQSEVDRDEWGNLEADWFDVVMDAAPPSVMEHVDGRSVDLGDRYVSDMVRPHFRLGEREEGYDIPPNDLIEFIEGLISRFEKQFGTYAMRMEGDNFRRRV